MSLLQMFPKVSSFKIVYKEEIKEIRLRKVSLSDHLFCNHEFGEEIKDSINSLAEKADVTNLCRLVYRQITEEDKKIFEVVKAETVDEDGKKAIVEFGGHKLLALLVDDINVYKDMIVAYTEAVIAGMPTMDVSEKK